MRLGEATALTRADVDLAEGMVTVRHAKFDRIRLVPLHPSVTAALRAYAATRDRHAGRDERQLRQRRIGLAQAIEQASIETRRG